jgi:methylglutaconyl-CoA hydratase
MTVISMPLQDSTWQVRHDGPVLHVQLLSPTLTERTLDGLITLLTMTVRDQPETRVLVLSSARDDFCLGGDRPELAGARRFDPSGAGVRGIADKGRLLCEALETTRLVTIARLHGRVVGAGLALAAYCDLRIASTTCTLRLPEVALGMVPAWGGALGRLIAEAGASRIRELLLTCKEIDAATAERYDLVHKVCAPADLDAQIQEWTEPLLRRPAHALAATKILLGAHSRATHLIDGAALDAHLFATQLMGHRT